MHYHTIAFITQTGVLLFFMAIFLGVLWYALSPRNKDKFSQAANIPLGDETYGGESSKGRGGK